MSADSFSDRQEAERQLDSFVLRERMTALKWLGAQGIARGRFSPERINMHIHSFFSYNSEGYSPCHIAWESHVAGLYAAGLCDFDVLDGLEEFFTACELLGVRATVNLETRAFFKEYATVDTSSPGEPGVTYIMGAGFVRKPKPASTQAETLGRLRRQAQERNIALVNRINARLPEIEIDYGQEVEPLSPAKCPTERHIVQAYRQKAERAFASRPMLSQFWAKLIGKTPDQIASLLSDTPSLEEKIRSVLVKSGGIGYEKPTDKTFPAVDDFVQWVLACEAVPMIAWLDGLNKGEDDIFAMLECMMSKGACALNIIPDRNHNIADPDLRVRKLAKLEEVVRACGQIGLPINIGTEMNKQGQPFSDDTGCEALRPYLEPFLSGARVMVGHTVLGRFADFSYTGKSAEAEFGRDVRRKNEFFAAVGKLPPLTTKIASRLKAMGQEKALACLRDSAAGQAWSL